MDDLDDLFSEPSSQKGGGRFQPKFKPRPKKGLSVRAKETKHQPVSTVPVDTGSNQVLKQIEVEQELAAPKISALPNSESVGTTDISCKEKASDSENLIKGGSLADPAREVGHSATPTSEVAPPKGVDTSSESQSPEDDCIPSEPDDMQTSNTFHDQNAQGIAVGTDGSFAGASPFRKCNALSTCKASVGSDALSGCHDEVLSSHNDSFQIDLEIDIEQEEEGFEAANAYGKPAVKFQPKPKGRGGPRRDSVEPASHLSDVSASPSQTQPVNGENSADDVELHATSPISGGVASVDLPEQSELPGDEMVMDEDPVSGVNDAGESTYEDPDLMNDEVQDRNGSFVEVSNDIGTNREDKTDDVDLSEQTSKKKRKRKPKKVASENDVSVRKRRKATKGSEQPIEKPPPKRFPRATQRKRCVNKALLEAPEDELDHHRIPIRDLLILADYRERQKKKEAAALPPSLTDQRTNDTLSEEPPYDDIDNAFNEDQNYDDTTDPSTSGPVVDMTYYNYHSFRELKPDRAKPSRWTKRDTEVFYEGVRQFGTNFLMIQQLHFPGRDRHQIKSKFKKEERENPMMLHEALTSRTTDLSHYELLLQKVTEIAEREKEENEMEEEDGDLNQPTGEEQGKDEATPDIHPNSQEEPAAQKQEESSACDIDNNDITQDGSPPKSYEDENDSDTDDFNYDLL